MQPSRTCYLDHSLQLITSFRPTDFNYLSAKKPFNSLKNRDDLLLPLETCRVALCAKPGVEGSDYINASWLHGNQKLREFILTQHPTEATKTDFWRMLWDHNAQTIVLLSSLDAVSRKNVMTDETRQVTVD